MPWCRLPLRYLRVSVVCGWLGLANDTLVQAIEVQDAHHDVESPHPLQPTADKVGGELEPAPAAVPQHDSQIDPDLLGSQGKAEPDPASISATAPLGPLPAPSLDVRVDSHQVPMHPALRLAMNHPLPPSEQQSPATPVGLGQEGLYHGYDMSRHSSGGGDWGSYIGATKGSITAASSESGLDFSVMEHGTPGGDRHDDGPGVPFPKDKSKKSHARKVSIALPVIAGSDNNLGSSNQTAISSALEMPSSSSGSISPIRISFLHRSRSNIRTSRWWCVPRFSRWRVLPDTCS